MNEVERFKVNLAEYLSHCNSESEYQKLVVSNTVAELEKLFLLKSESGLRLAIVREIPELIGCKNGKDYIDEDRNCGLCRDKMVYAEIV